MSRATSTTSSSSPKQARQMPHSAHPLSPDPQPHKVPTLRKAQVIDVPRYEVYYNIGLSAQKALTRISIGASRGDATDAVSSAFAANDANHALVVAPNVLVSLAQAEESGRCGQTDSAVYIGVAVAFRTFGYGCCRR
jgi:hypothetical protein